jgi:hypothetical protein
MVRRGTFFLSELAVHTNWDAEASLISRTGLAIFKSFRKGDRIFILNKGEPEGIVRVVADVTVERRAELLKRGRRGVVHELLIEMLYRCGGLNQEEIGETLGMDYSSVSVARKRYRVRADEDMEVGA